MIDSSNFKIWLSENTDYSDKTIGNIVSRLKRADLILPWSSEEIYLYKLEHQECFSKLSDTVRSQIKKSVKLYTEYQKSDNDNITKPNSQSPYILRALSMFSNIGVAEAYLDKIGVNVVIANELIERRATLYSKIYPNTHMICGDITNNTIRTKVINESIEKNVDVIIATPPCQGMSTAGRQEQNDVRNTLICQVVDVIHKIHPKYVFIENVPLFLNTSIIVDNRNILIPDYLNENFAEEYIIHYHVIDVKDYSVPQTRERTIILMSKRGEHEWTLPERDNKIVTMKDAIGNLPILDPIVKDVDEAEHLKMFPKFKERLKVAQSISCWHNPPEHVKRQVIAMQHTPSGCTAFDNKVYYPVKENGQPVRGYHNTYCRQSWDRPAYTVTMDNRKISSQNNVHPGREEYINADGEIIYSDPRTLTLYELMIIMSLPDDWNVPKNTSEAFLRRIIGEGIPPLFVKKVFNNLIKELQ